MLVTLSACYGCKKNADETTVAETTQTTTTQTTTAAPTTVKQTTTIATTTTEPPTEEQTEPEKVILGDQMKSWLTGLFIPKEKAEQRPVAVMIDNASTALPQSGIAQADIYYETLVEGGITRLLATFQNYDAEKIGPVRSARSYYVGFAEDNDAVYIHHGGSPGAYSDLKKYSTSHVDGIYDGNAFWRDSDRVKRGIGVHSSYTSAARLAKAFETYKFRNQIDTHMFQFLDEGVAVTDGEAAPNVLVKYSSIAKMSFKYDTDTKLYYRFQNGKKHIDDQTGNQLSVSNVIIQYAKISDIKNDEAGRQEIETIGSGDGLLITQGQSIKIKWSKSSLTSPTKWQLANGDTLNLTPGKTWICIFQKGGSIVLDYQE